MFVAEDNAQRIVLKVQGGKLETIARNDVEEVAVSKVSLMPENLETLLKPQEIADLRHSWFPASSRSGPIH